MSSSSADDRIRDLEAMVARLSTRVDALEREATARAGVEHASAAALGNEAGMPPAAASAGVDVASAQGWIGFLGRTLIVLGGAFLLRALTESGQLPPAAGVWIGLAYAAVWLALAARASGASAFFHGLSALLVGLPLVLEAALKFRVLPPPAGATVLAVLAILSLVVSWRRRQRTLAMATALGALATAFALAFGTGTMLPSAVALIAIGTASLWVGYAARWDWLAWPVAAAADLSVLALALRAIASPPRDGPVLAQATHALLMLAYLFSFVIRILLHERDVRLFEVAQTAAVLLIGLTGASLIAHAQGAGAITIALPCLSAGAFLYVQTFARVVPRRGFGAEFYYVGMTALALVLVGLSLLFPHPARPVAVAVAALGVSLVAWRASHPMLALQGAIAAVVASAESGLVTFTAMVWLTHSQPWPAATAPIWIVLAVVLAALCMPRTEHEGEPPMLASVARVALSIALVAGAGSLVVIGLGQLAAGTLSAGAIATMKTVILAVSAVGLAYAGRTPRFVEFGWLAYAVLSAGALKILAEDFPTSRPSTLFIALGLYGAALIWVPRILRKT